jgi:hypothetical protein
MGTHADQPVHRCLAILIVIAATGIPTGALRAAGVYRSVDAQGHVVYSDQPDMSVPQTQVDIAPSNSYSGADAQANEPPPPLPDSDQPVCPEDGYLWTPGFWAWGTSGYYWVVGGWVEPPRVGLLWTPAYWEYADDVYLFHQGYWASDVGYYGGIDYGFGYFGAGYAGGRWVGHSFAYNRAVSNVGAGTFHNIYSEPANRNPNHNRVSYNGGPGGTLLAPSAQERARLAQTHIAPTLLQRRSLVQAARPPALEHPLAAGPRPYVPNVAPAAAARGYAAQPSFTQREPSRGRSNTVSAQAAAPHPRAPLTRSLPSSRVTAPLQTR